MDDWEDLGTFDTLRISAAIRDGWRPCAAGLARLPRLVRARLRRHLHPQQYADRSRGLGPAAEGAAWGCENATSRSGTMLSLSQKFN